MCVAVWERTCDPLIRRSKPATLSRTIRTHCSLSVGRPLTGTSVPDRSGLKHRLDTTGRARPAASSRARRTRASHRAIYGCIERQKYSDWQFMGWRAAVCGGASGSQACRTRCRELGHAAEGRNASYRSPMHLRGPRPRVGCAPVCRRVASRPPPTRSGAPSAAHRGYFVGSPHR